MEIFMLKIVRFPCLIYFVHSVLYDAFFFFFFSEELEFGKALLHQMTQNQLMFEHAHFP